MRSVGERWHSLRERRRGSADEAAGGEHVERPGTLTDEVRRRLEARGVRDAPARKQRDALGAEEPRRAFRCIAGVRVLGQQDQKSSAELLVERREDERERCLGDTGATREGFVNARKRSLAASSAMKA